MKNPVKNHHRLSVQPRVDRPMPQESCSHDQENSADPLEIRHCRGRREKIVLTPGMARGVSGARLKHRDLGIPLQKLGIADYRCVNSTSTATLTENTSYNKASKPSGTLNTQGQTLKHSVIYSILLITIIFFLTLQ